MYHVVNMFTGAAVAELSKAYRVTSGSLKLPRELMLRESNGPVKDGEVIKDGFTMVKPGQRGYREALDDWLTGEGLEISG